MPGKAFTLNGVKYKCIGNATNIERMYKGARRRTAMSLKFAILLFFNLFKYRFDLIDTDSFPFLHIPLTFIYAKLTGAKLVITWHEVWSKDFWKDYFPILGFIGFFFEWLAARMGSAHIANSYTTKTLLHKILKVKTSDIYVLPAAVNEKEINDFTEKYGSSCKKENKFIVINRLVKHKRVDLAIKSIKKVNAELVIVGEGPEKENLEKLVDHYGISTRVEFKSNLTPVELYKELCTFVALIVTSEREGLSLVTVEALALGVPVVVADTTSLPKELKALCAEAREDKLGSLLNEVLQHKEEYAKKYQQIKKLALSKFSSTKANAIYLEILKSKNKIK